jgi:RNA polymerase sigma factor (sigma-70 family)
MKKAIRGVNPASFRGQRKEVWNMNPQDLRERIRHRFDAYCKRILKRAVYDYWREVRRRGEREVSFSELSAREFASLTTTDEYFKDGYVFDVLGESVGVSDADLAEALKSLPADRREIVLMSYFFDMTDREIADELNMKRRTVAHRRASTLEELKVSLESED